ncbi:MAG: hypothetical protein EHM71_18485, partial [Zetaproteobacteria bacterium]
MYQPCAMRRRWLPVAAVLLVLFTSGCGDDDPATPAPEPDLKLSLAPHNGVLDLKLRNDGGPMSGAAALVAAFEDGQRDTLYLQPGAADSVSCRLSNIHGCVTVTSEAWGLEASADDCLKDSLEDMMDSLQLDSLMPSPVAILDIGLCTYAIHVDNLDSDPVTFELVRSDSGLTMRYVFRNLHGDLRGVGSNWACADQYGDVGITSVVVEADIDIDEGGNPEVSLGEAEAAVNGLDVNVDGILGS